MAIQNRLKETQTVKTQCKTFVLAVVPHNPRVIKTSKDILLLFYFFRRCWSSTPQAESPLTLPASSESHPIGWTAWTTGTSFCCTLQRASLPPGTEHQSGPVVWYEAVTAAVVWWRALVHLGWSCCPAGAVGCWPAPAEQPARAGSPPLPGWTLASWHLGLWCGPWTEGPGISTGPQSSCARSSPAPSCSLCWPGLLGS